MSRERKMWGVVTSRKDGRRTVLHVEGPYFAKAEAEDVADANRRDEPFEAAPEMVGKLRYAVVPMVNTLSHREMFGHTVRRCSDEFDHPTLYDARRAAHLV